MSLSIKHSADGSLATLSGEFTIGTLENLKPGLLELLQHPRLVLDLSEVTEFDGCGLQLLTIVLIEAVRRQQPITLEPLSQPMHDCMHLLGFDAAAMAAEEACHGSV